MYRVVSGCRKWIVTRRRCVLSALLGVSLLALAGCGTGDEAGAEASSVTTVTVTDTATMTETVTKTAFVTPTVEPSMEAENPSSETDSESPAATAEGPTILKPGAARDRDLDLNDVFDSWGKWDQQRLDVASEVGVRSLSTEVNYCTAENGSGLELRLANGFEKLSFSAGQANISKSSDMVMKIEVQGNDKQLDTLSVPFNSIVDLSIDVRGVNALKIFVYLEQRNNGYCDGTITAMLYKLQLS